MNKGLLSKLKKDAKRVLSRASARGAASSIYFLHIGKNAGSNVAAILDAVQKEDPKMSFRKVGHHTRMEDIPASAAYFFSVRSPVTRFRSGFYSRKRMGRPLYDFPWSICETEAFTRFEHANDLAEALFEPGRTGHDATAAILSISHTSMNQVNWFERWGYAMTVRPPVWIIRQEQFQTDMASFLGQIGKPDILASKDPKAVHSNDYKDVPPLSAKAVENLRRWYCQDFAFYELCENWIESQQSGTEDRPKIG